MSNIKNKDTIYAVMRISNTTIPGNSIVCCFTKTEEYAQELANRYEQDFLDRGIDDFTFYVVGNIYYDE